MATMLPVAPDNCTGATKPPGAARTSAAQAHALVMQRQRAGLATQLEVLAAQKPLLQLDQQLAALVAQRRIAAVDLEQALGGGIDLAPRTPLASR